MSKMTLLELVQDIAAAIDSDEITSIADTVEGDQIATVVRDTYYQMIANNLIPEHRQLSRLNNIDLTTYPNSKNYLVIPDEVDKVYWIKYNKRRTSDTFDSYKDLIYCDPLDFMNLVNMNRSDDTDNLAVASPSTGVVYYVQKDKPPEYWTSFNDDFIALDSIDLAVDTTQVLGSKTQAFVSLFKEWEMNDSFVPELGENLFPFLLAEAKATCFTTLKQTANNKIEKQSRDQKIKTQNARYRTTEAQEASTGSTGPNYGRK
jgi:hypothetical protein